MAVRIFTLLALLAACAQVAAESAVTVDAVRSLGAQIARAADQFDHGTAPSSVEMSDLEHRLSLTRASIAAGTDQTGVRKFTAIAMRFEKLKFDIAYSSAPALVPGSLPRSQIDLESVSATHGATCANALGIALDRPVRLTLQNSSDAWFFISGVDAANLRFRTTSAGPDPSLEVFAGCEAGAQSIASNDDGLGLDADVVAVNAPSQTLFVHLANSGVSGIVMLNATVAPGSVNGSVKDIKTNAPVANAYITLYSTTYGYSAYGYADQNGNYSATAPQAGTYYVVASAQSYVTQLYPTGNCPYGIYYYSSECDLSQAHTVTVTATGSVSNINFSLSTGQKISGEVRATDNTPLSQSSVSLLMPNGQGVTSVNTDTAGHFVFTTLPPGSYVIQAFAQGYGSQLYDNVPCAGPSQSQCNALAANVVIVASQDVTDVDFRLPRLSSFTGKVTGSDGQPLSSVSLIVLDKNGNNVAYGGTDNYGNYTAGSIGTGTYYIYASGNTVFSQLYPAHDCISNCVAELSEATAFTFTSVGQSIEADFVLDYFPTLSGHITDATTGAPLRNVQVFLNTQPPSMSGYSNLNSVTDGLGNYGIPNVPAGQYFVWAQSSDHVDQVYSGIICEATNYYSSANCNIAGATLLTVVAGEQTVPSFDFALNASSRIGGHAGIRAGAGSDIPASITTTIYDGTGTVIGYAASDADGNYVITDVAPGTYYAVATPNYYGTYISQIWQGIDCSTCVATTGTPIVLGTGVSATDVDFQVTRLDAVVGRIVDDHGTPVSGAVVDLFSSIDRSYVSGAGTDQNGFYMVSAPVGSSYYLATEAGGGYTDQIYSGISCPNGTAYDQKCPLSGGTPVNVNAGATQPHIVNFVLIPNDRVFENGFD